MFNNSTFNNCIFINKDFQDFNSPKQEEKDEPEESGDADHAGVLNEQPTSASNTPFNQLRYGSGKYSLPPFISYIVNRSKVRQIMEWLHLTMDSIESPKAKLIYLRSLYEAGYFTKLVPRKVFIEEFGYISKSNYNAGMGKKLNYERDDINSIIEQLPF